MCFCDGIYEVGSNTNPLQHYLDNPHILLQGLLDHLPRYHILHYLVQLRLVDSLCGVVMLLFVPKILVSSWFCFLFF